MSAGGPSGTTVTQQWREIGIRVALGAPGVSIVSRVLRSAAKVTAVGVAVGVFVAWWGAGSIRSLLYGVAARDLAAFLLVPGLLFAAGVLAALAPAVRATRLDPLATIRQD